MASLKQLMNLSKRRLEECRFVVLILDGKKFGPEWGVVALVVTAEWRKGPLGLIRTGMKNERVCREMWEGLLKGRLEVDHELLSVVDGDKG